MRSIPCREIVPYLLAGALFLLILSVYWQAGENGFVSIDDPQYVTGNPKVLGGITREGASWAFTTFYFANWHPLTWLSHMLDVELFGLSAGWHHRMNVFIHLLNTELLFFLLWRMTGGLWQGAFVAALFAVHPLHVESVAWVAGRKDVLSALFWLLTTGAYLRYVQRPGLGRYLLVVAAFAAGLMTKPVLVTLPFTLLLLDVWPLGRIASADPSGADSPRLRAFAFFRRVLEKTPLFALSAASCVVTYLAQTSSGTIAASEKIPANLRMANAVVSYAAYLEKTVWPSSLSVFYPHPSIISVEIPAWRITGAILLLAGISFLAFVQRRRRPCIAVGWLWYLGTLVPMIGLMQAGGQAMADRYTYIPLIGIFMAFGWSIPSVLGGLHFRQIGMGIAGCAAIAAYSAATWNQIGYWRDNFSLFSHAREVTEKNWMAMLGLGEAHEKLGQYPQAAGYFSELVRVMPNFYLGWYNLGVVYGKQGEFSRAAESYREALRLKPDLQEGWFNLCVAYENLGETRQASECFEEAMRIKR